MEFKFSCKWFEVEFSGDPGFVESQIEKYEPFIQHALKVMERETSEPEIKPLPRVQDDEPAQTPKRHDSRPPDRQGRDHGKQSRRKGQKGGPNAGDQNSRRDFGHDRKKKPYSEKARDRSGNDRPAREPEPESIGNGGTDNSFEHHADAREPSESRSFAAHPEFVSRRRAPKIRAEQLEKVIGRKRPRTHHDRIMVFGYYMENEGNGTDFTIAEIKRCYREMGQDPGVNIEQVINHATRSGFVAGHNKGRVTRYKLSNKGRRYVEDGLKLS